MSDAQLSGEDIMRQNMAAFESGEDLPHNEELTITSDPTPEPEEPESLEGSQDDGYEEEPQEELEASEDDDARHMSKEDWVAAGKDPDTYLTPDEFKRVGDLRGESNLALAKKFAQQESMMKEILSNQNQSITDAKNREREKVLAELKQQQAEAIEFSDTEKAVELERKIASHETVDKPVDNTPKPDDGVAEFYESNKDWYDSDPAAKGMLNTLLTRCKNRGLSFNEAIDESLPKVKAQFHYLFDDAQAPEAQAPVNKKAVAPRPTAVSEKSRKASKPASKKRSFSELDASMQTFARKAAKASGLTEQQYMEQM